MSTSGNSSGIRKILTIVLFVVVLAIIVATLFFVANRCEKDYVYQGEKELIEIGGKKYYQKNIETYLVIGIDESGTIQGTGSYTNNQKADFVSLIIFDRVENKVSVLQLNRDTMLKNDVLGFGEMNQYYRTGKQNFEQLALSHTYGDGLASSNLNVRRSVSRLLYGLTIDYYVSMTIDAVGILNDEFGGVTVTMPKDYTDIDASFTNGTAVNLDGELAMKFIRSRLDTLEPTNTARMERQKLYVEAFIEKVKNKNITTSFAYNLYAKLVEDEDNAYILTNANKQKIYQVLSELNNYEFDKIYIPEGETSYDNEFAEFYVDEDALAELCVKLFYTEVG